jgi:DtxR family Mn-dependent transcriptional regulator
VKSISVQDYLLAIYRLQEGEALVSTTALAQKMDVAPASVTDMVRKLHRKGLVEYQPYHGVLLSPDGERQALQLLRHHRLWELFLTQVLGLPWEQVHVEAHRLEHATSDQVAEHLAEFLGQPVLDPHGHRIPASDGSLPLGPRAHLIELEPGRAARVAAVPDDDPDVLRQLAARGIVPGAMISMVDWDTVTGSMLVAVGDQIWAVERQVARQVQME